MSEIKLRETEIDSVSFSRDGLAPHVKSPIIWANVKSGGWPLCYLTKPKWMSKEDWEWFLDHFDWSLRL